MKAVESFETLGTTSSVTQSNMPDGVNVGTAASVFTEPPFNTAASVFSKERLALLCPSLPNDRLTLLRLSLATNV